MLPCLEDHGCILQSPRMPQPMYSVVPLTHDTYMLLDHDPDRANAIGYQLTQSNHYAYWDASYPQLSSTRCHNCLATLSIDVRPTSHCRTTQTGHSYSYAPCPHSSMAGHQARCPETLCQRIRAW